MPNPNLLNEQVGLTQTGWIDSYNPITDTLFVKLNNAPITSNNPAIEVPGPHVMFYNNGMYIGTLPAPGTPVILAPGSGGQYHFVAFKSENLDILPELTLGEVLIQANEDTKITLNDKFDVNIGSHANRVHINTYDNFISTNFYNDYHFTQAVRRVDGLVKRDLIRNINFDQNSKLEMDDYNAYFYTIPMDPQASPTSLITGSAKNPPFVEHREMVYEFQYSSNVNDDLSESTLYSDTGTKTTTFTLPNRRISRADTLSLTLAAPNYLIETVKGTVVDIFGNILDLNRSPLPIGKEGQVTIRADKSSDKVKSFLTIKELQRKSIAYHFEINARKDLTGANGQTQLPDINSNDDYARARSRFFIDIDKEGQFKLNVPASSEKGNIPLLARYENYSTFGPDDNNNPNKFIVNEDRTDIALDSFAQGKSVPHDTGSKNAAERGVIAIMDGDANGAPIDRIVSTQLSQKTHIKHGTAYHDITDTCFVHQSTDYVGYQFIEPPTVNLSDLTFPGDIVSATINVSGDNANAGGRSGSINFDGSIEMNIGANTIDRQSLWLDTAGGTVANLGRDKLGRSLLASTDGHFFLQVGNFGIEGDSRFGEDLNGLIDNILDIRVLGTGGDVTVIRCDKNGITLMTPGAMKFHAGGDVVFTSDSDIRFECEQFTVQERPVIRTLGGSV